MPFPTWLRTSEVSARAVWDARAEDASQVAGRVDRLRSSLDGLLGTGSSWMVVEDCVAAPADAVGLASVIDEHVYRDAEGIPFPTRGYLLSIAREGVAGFLAIRMRVGSSTTSKRMPANAVHATLAGPKKDEARLSIDLDLAEGVLQGLVTAFEPDSAATSGARGRAGDGGHHIDADDQLDSESAVLEVWSTLQSNGITEIVHREEVARPDQRVDGAGR